MSCLSAPAPSISDESLAEWLNSLKYEWKVRHSLYPESFEEADLKANGFDARHNTLSNLPILLQALWELDAFKLDGYHYRIWGSRIERIGPKVAPPPPPEEWKVAKIIGAPI